MTTNNEAHALKVGDAVVLKGSPSVVLTVTAVDAVVEERKLVVAEAIDTDFARGRVKIAAPAEAFTISAEAEAMQGAAQVALDLSARLQELSAVAEKTAAARVAAERELGIIKRGLDDVRKGAARLFPDWAPGLSPLEIFTSLLERTETMKKEANDQLAALTLRVRELGG